MGKNSRKKVEEMKVPALYDQIDKLLKEKAALQSKIETLEKELKELKGSIK